MLKYPPATVGIFFFFFFYISPLRWVAVTPSSEESHPGVDTLICLVPIVLSGILGKKKIACNILKGSRKCRGEVR